MSKSLTKFVEKAQAIKNASSKFTPAALESHRIIPSRIKDAEFQFRIDAGHYDEETKCLNVVLQVNSQATSPALKEWIKKHSTHEKLAIASFNTATTHLEKEYGKLLDTLQEARKKKLG